MLKSVKKLESNIFSLEIVLEGRDYQEALLHYMDYIPDYLKFSFDNELFPKGQTPIAVNEEAHGDDIYRYVLETKFPYLYQDAVAASNLTNALLKEIKIIGFSKEKISLTALVESKESKSSEHIGNTTSTDVESSNPCEILNRTMTDISNVDMLIINSSVKRDEWFWKNLQAWCVAYGQQIHDEFLPVLNEIGVIELRNGAIWIDIGDENSMRFIYPILEIAIFPTAVFAAALREYITEFTKEDEQNLKKYIFSCVDDILSPAEQLDNVSKKALLNRLSDYSIACYNEVFSGYSLYGEHGVDYEDFMDYERLNAWTRNHQVKCAHMLCDYVAYIKNFRNIASLDDLKLLKSIVEKNTPKELETMMKLFDKAHSYAEGIYMRVRGMLNGSCNIKWKAMGQCQYCGGEFKKTLFAYKCKDCKTKKDY